MQKEIKCTVAPLPIIKYEKGYLVAYMPNGEVIPAQTNLVINNASDQRGRAEVTVSFLADISKISPSDESLKNEWMLKNEKLVEEIRLWQNRFNKEREKKWWQKIFDKEYDTYLWRLYDSTK